MAYQAIPPRPESAWSEIGAGPSPVTRLMSVTIERTSRILICGDSLSDPAFPYQMFLPLQDACTAYYGPGGPTFVNVASAGATIAAVVTQASVGINSGTYSHVLFGIGTNERVVTRAETQSAIASLVSLLNSKPGVRQVMVVGPYAWGEKYPSGQNDITGANDTRLDETCVDLTNGLTWYPRNVFVDLRYGLGSVSTTGMFSTVMPAINTPPPGASIGPFTVDGAHWNSAGRSQVYATISPFIVFT